MSDQNGATISKSQKGQQRLDQSSEQSDATQPFSVRLDDETQMRLEKAAEAFRKKTGSRESASGLARTFIVLGLAQFEKTGGLVISA